MEYLALLDRASYQPDEVYFRNWKSDGDTRSGMYMAITQSWPKRSCSLEYHDHPLRRALCCVQVIWGEVGGATGKKGREVYD